jgi:curved DNA-binding protein CbpA
MRVSFVVEPRMGGLRRVLLRQLGLTTEATPGDVKRAYRALALEHHPDRGGDPEEFRRVTNVYRALQEME